MNLYFLTGSKRKVFSNVRSYSDIAVIPTAGFWANKEVEFNANLESAFATESEVMDFFKGCRVAINDLI